MFREDCVTERLCSGSACSVFMEHLYCVQGAPVLCLESACSVFRERLLMQMADRMAADGYKDVGYEYIVVDDCWLADTRDAQGKLRPDPRRFPHGMRALANYVSRRCALFDCVT